MLQEAPAPAARPSASGRGSTPDAEARVAGARKLPAADSWACEPAWVEIEINFSLRGSRGRVHIDLRPATGAGSSGRGVLDPSLPEANGAGLPVCTATVDYAGVGYTAAMGWVQFVRSSDSANPNVFELDPLALYADVNTPYAFFGIKPTLFDAPYRDLEEELVWEARSYLATSPDAVLTRAAIPLLAFGWGFRVAAGWVALLPPARLGIAWWSEHLPVLEDAHPGWSFRS